MCHINPQVLINELYNPTFANPCSESERRTTGKVFYYGILPLHSYRRVLGIKPVGQSRRLIMMRVKISLHWCNVLGPVLDLVCRNKTRREDEDLAHLVTVERESERKLHWHIQCSRQYWNGRVWFSPILVPVDGDVLHFVFVIIIIIFSKISIWIGSLLDYICLRNYIWIMPVYLLHTHSQSGWTEENKEDHFG